VINIDMKNNLKYIRYASRTGNVQNVNTINCYWSHNKSHTTIQKTAL